MKKKALAILAAVLCIVLLAGCIAKREAKDMYKPIWQGNTMIEESLVLVQEEDGTITGKLLFEPTEIIRVNNYTLENEYGKDEYRFEGRTFIATEASTMPYFTAAQYYDADDSALQEIGVHHAKEEGKNILFTESAGIVKFHVNVTYKHKGGWAGPKPVYQGAKLPKTVKKLKEEKALSLFMTGDSIAAGANSSSNLNIEPLRPSFGPGFSMELEDWYKADVEFENKAVGGWLSGDGVNNIVSLMQGYAPDLAILAFGMNDAAHTVPPSNYESNIRQMIDVVREANPNAEFILIATMMANPLAPQDRIQKDYLPVLNTIAADTAGCVVVDMTTFTEEMYKYKRGMDFLANNINHPSDFLMRCYTMNLMAAVCEDYL